jgi:uncharacterized membrane protein
MVLQVTLIQPANGEESAGNSLSFTVYADGYVFAEYTVIVDPENPMANITVFGQAISETVVVDEENLPLEYLHLGGHLSVYTLGAGKVKVSYFTQDLTAKDGRFWTINVTTPINSSVLLPAYATVMSFNQVPNLMDSVGDQILLLMPAGQVEITYVTGVVGTREYTQVILNEAEQAINSVKAQNVTVAAAEATLQQALNYFNSERYLEAEDLGNQAKSQALQTNQTAAQAIATKAAAESEIEKAEQEGRTVGLDEARDLFAQSENAYREGNYSQALTLATESKNKAEMASQPSASPSASSGTQFPMFEVAVIALISGSAGVVIFLIFRSLRKNGLFRHSKSKKPVDVERIFRRNDLRQEEKDAVQLMVEGGGEVLEAELYSKLNLPRTTTWRLVKRLEKMGIVEISKRRRENVVRLKK